MFCLLWLILAFLFRVVPLRAEVPQRVGQRCMQWGHAQCVVCSLLYMIHCHRSLKNTSNHISPQQKTVQCVVSASPVTRIRGSLRSMFVATSRRMVAPKWFSEELHQDWRTWIYHMLTNLVAGTCNFDVHITWFNENTWTYFTYFYAMQPKIMSAAGYDDFRFTQYYLIIIDYGLP